MRILLVSLFLPQEKAYHAGGRYVFEILRHMARTHEVHLATRLREDEFPCLEELRPWCRAIHPWPYPATARRGLLDAARLALNYLGFSRFADRLIRSGGYDLVQVEWVESALLIGRGKTPMVLDAHDVITKPAQRGMENSRGLARGVAQLRYLLVRAVERRVSRRFAAVFTLSDYDRGYLLDMLPGLDVRTIPIPAGLDIGDRSFPRESGVILFLASYRYRPVNVRGALWFYREVFPLVRARIPHARFVIAGYGPPAELTALAAEDSQVSVPGFVDDLEACYKQAAVFVAPILTGGGIIVKVLDALAAGTPVVTTTYGNEGVAAHPGRDLLVADDPAGFAAAVVAVLEDPALAARLGEAGRAHVAGQFSRATVLEKMESAWRDVVAPGGRKELT